MSRTKKKTPKRRYRSAQREAGRDATRVAILEAAARLLREHQAARFSLEAVAERANVTRLTVYNQFGDRRGLLEAVFDEEAKRGGLVAIPQAMQLADPRAALERIVQIFCAFWAERGPLHGVVAQAMTDAELDGAIRERNERRRTILETLVLRMNPKSKKTARLVDTLFALTSFAFHAELTRSRLSKAEVEEATLGLVRAAVRSSLNSP